jgi:hypothetical protein
MADEAGEECEAAAAEKILAVHMTIEKTAYKGSAESSCCHGCCFLTAAIPIMAL